MVGRYRRQTLEELSIEADALPFVLERDLPGDASDLAPESASAVTSEGCGPEVTTREFSVGHPVVQMILDGGQHEA
jgi:hypothetical protein